MHILTRPNPDGTVTLLLRGTLTAACVADVEGAVAQQLRTRVVLDLSKVGLVDRPTLQ